MSEVIRKIKCLQFCLLEQYVKINSSNPFRHLTRLSLSQNSWCDQALFLLSFPLLPFPPLPFPSLPFPSLFFSSFLTYLVSIYLVNIKLPEILILQTNIYREISTLRGETEGKWVAMAFSEKQFSVSITFQKPFQSQKERSPRSNCARDQRIPGIDTSPSHPETPKEYVKSFSNNCFSTIQEFISLTKKRTQHEEKG